MKKICSIVILLMVALGAEAQPQANVEWQKIIEAKMPDGIQMSSGLYQLAIFSKRYTEDAYRRAKEMKFRFHPQSRQLVNVEVIYRKAENSLKINDVIHRNVLETVGFTVAGTWKNRASCWIKIENALTLSEKLTKDYYIEAVYESKLDNEGPAAMNCDGYRSGSSLGGSGIRIAVFDGGFGNYQTRINNGVAPNPVYCWANGVTTNVAGVTGGVHGSACVETAFDNAPNATYELYVVNNGTEMGQAINLCIAHGVDIISHSMSRYNAGWYDNSGPYCNAVEDAIAANILFFTSSGNRAQSHWEGSFADADADNFLNFSGGDELNTITYTAGNNLHVALSWQPNANVDYDLYVYNSNGNVVGSSTNSGSNFEELNINPSSGTYGIAVYKIGTANATLEFFTHQNGVSDYQYQTAAGSNTSPSNMSQNNCISVGAVHVNDYADAAGTSGIITDYSSRGPTNSGNLVPKVVAPTSTSTETYGTLGFSGTSCSTPNAAGMAAAFWSAHTHLDATGVRQVIYRMAQLYKDWGASGTDQVYGNGGLFLYEYASNQRYLYRTSENSAVTNNTRPYYSMGVSQSNAPNNATVVILNNGAYNDTGLYGNTASSGSGKSIFYRYPFSGNASFGY